jgi:hypothetical protein
MRNDILRYLRMIPSATTEMIADDLGLVAREVQRVLHHMDDENDVILRNGWYRISEKARNAK